MPVVQRVCAWCDVAMGVVAMAVPRGESGPGANTTHCLCDDCTAQLLLSLREGPTRPEREDGRQRRPRRLSFGGRRLARACG